MGPALRLLAAVGMVLALLASSPVAAQLREVPTLTTRVTDEAGMLDASQRQRLEAVLAEYEEKTGSQIAVLLVKSTEPEAIEQFGIRVTDAWKLGRKGVDDGVLLLVARDNPSALRRLRIEAGRGVQGVLTDAQSKRILQDVIAPHFRQNHYYEGLVAGVGSIATLLNQEAFPAPVKKAAAPQEQGSWIGWLFFLIVLSMFLRSLFRPRRRGVLQGSRTGGKADWSSAATGYIIGSILSNASRGGGFGGGGGGGGFSGGGGGFDGGGASGDW